MRKASVLLLLICTCLLQQGCFTSSLWRHQIVQVEQTETRIETDGTEREVVRVVKQQVPHSTLGIAGQTLATPVAVAGDITGTAISIALLPLALIGLGAIGW